MTSFGSCRHGAAKLFMLKNPAGSEIEAVSITDYGATVVAIRTKDKHGNYGDIVCGFDSANDYETQSPYFGCIVGRYANRISDATFTLDGRTIKVTKNDPPNMLHGGAEGFDKKLWRMLDASDTQLRLEYVSADGEEGFPGELTVTATYRLEPNCLRLHIEATTKAKTVVNLTNHSYFNLEGHGEGTILQHELQIEAGSFTPINEVSIPLGAIRPVEGTNFDFSAPTPIGDRIDRGDTDDQLKNGLGYDHNFCLRGGLVSSARRVATLRAPMSGRVMEVHTNQPGIQFYSGNFLDGTLVGKGGKVYPYRGALCLEPQLFPNSPNQIDFPSCILEPADTYIHDIAYHFAHG
ncbi:unnamed protein product [Vitrella brassicaformis CCMP3155]|uniref:Aldose 1-epimerase n=2 Tax=Vitrella brassicaformis TaxID=1169539 RepID=A0A0G4EJS7_VITBC|nr:unnamed protein product [Vitrella brassicaformis CCMP3155]|eukprot:CEL97685.1 unnamed protein product [Vitrella brassicaformis CCMP3155]